LVIAFVATTVSAWQLTADETCALEAIREWKSSRLQDFSEVQTRGIMSPNVASFAAAQGHFPNGRREMRRSTLRRRRQF
jgi:hypothetical protein